MEQAGPSLLSNRVHVLPQTNQIKEIQTVIRERDSNRGDFKFYADRLIRLVVEESLNLLPYAKITVTTPLGEKYEGLRYERGNCGVSIMRSGEAMELGLRDCCQSMAIGKILFQTEHENKILYARLPEDISKKRVLLMYPILRTGVTVTRAVEFITSKFEVKEENIILLSLFATPKALQSLTKQFPSLQVLTSEVDDVVPFHFGTKYFGTD